MTSRRCDACGAGLSRLAVEPICPTCHASARHGAPSVPPRQLMPAVWLWSAPEATAALRSRDLATILRVYRRLNKLSQERLAALLGYDKTYVSMIETGRRNISDVATRRHIARTLGLPMHALGVTDNDDADFAAMIQFGDSTIRLAEIARQSGRAVDAVNELWPLVARLEARAAEGRAERDTMILLGQGRAALGVSLGTVLPEERLTAAARWTGKALVVAERLGDRAFLAHALRMHGNELRKADHVGAAIARLSRAVAVSEDREGQGAAFALLARAAGEHGDPELFDLAINGYRERVDDGGGRSMLFNPFTFRRDPTTWTGRDWQSRQCGPDHAYEHAGRSTSRPAVAHHRARNSRRSSACCSTTRRRRRSPTHSARCCRGSPTPPPDPAHDQGCASRRP